MAWVREKQVQQDPHCLSRTVVTHERKGQEHARGPVLRVFHSYLGAETTHKVGAQHMLNAEYFKRIDALNYTMMHDDGQMIDELEKADVVLVGVSRTSKTPTSIYLANRGVKTANYPLVAAGQGQFSSAGSYSEVLNYAKDGASYVVLAQEGKVPVDALIVKVSEARSRDELKTATSALDRVLRAGHYWVPHWYRPYHYIAY